MEQFNRSLLSSELPVTESFWQNVFTFRSKSLSLTKLSQELDHHHPPPPPKKLMLLNPNPQVSELPTSVCERFFSWGSDLGLCLCPR